MGLILLLLVPLGAAIWSPLWVGICVLITSSFSSSPPSGEAGRHSGFDSRLCAVGGVPRQECDHGFVRQPFVNVVISLVIGAVLGYLAEKLTAALAKK